MSEATLLKSFELLATAPGGVARLRELILTLAVQGKLVPQDPNDEPAGELLKRIRVSKDRLIAEGKIKRDKSPTKVADEERLFALPPSWELVRLADIGIVASSSRVHQGDWKGSGVPFYRAREIVKLSKESRVANELFISEELFASLTRDGSAPQENDIMITGVGTIGVPYVVRKSDRFYFKDASVLIFKNYAQLNAQYLSLFMRSPVWVDSIHEYSMGTTVDTLTIARANAALVPLPPLAEQRRIVARVEELMKLCDALEEKGRLADEQHTRLTATLFDALANSESAHALAERWKLVAEHFDLLLDRPEAVDALEQTILQLAVRGLLVPQDPKDEPASELLKKIRAEKDRLIAEGKIKRDKPLPSITEDEKPYALPASWEWVRLGTVADSRLGKMLDKAKNTGQLVPYLRNTNVQWRRFDLEDIKKLKLEPTELDEFRLRPGDLLICEGGEPGRCAIWRDEETEMYFQKALHRVRMLGDASPELVAVCLEVDAHSGALDAHFTGATIKHFVGKELESYLIPFPPIAEQLQIVAHVGRLRSLCADLRKRLTASQSAQSRLAESLVAEVA